MRDGIWINGQWVMRENLASPSDVVSDEIKNFLKEWWDGSECIQVQTSGSTGTPKTYFAEKKRMLASAKMTCDFFNLNEGDSILLCMPVKFIGAKMILVRALQRGLRVIAVRPSMHPLADIEEMPCFAAMTPAQALSSLKYHDQEANKFKSIRNVVIGGAAVTGSLLDEIRKMPNNVWATYGMTETLSHIALRKLNGDDASERYYPLNGISIELAENETLIISAPDICQEAIHTNDMALIHSDGGFEIIGRIDNVINTGGIKINAEKIEEFLASILPMPFAITSIPDDLYGEIIVLVTTNCDLDKDWITICHDALPKYWTPKRHFKLDSIPLTESGKIDRHELKRIVRLIV